VKKLALILLLSSLAWGQAGNTGISQPVIVRPSGAMTDTGGYPSQLMEDGFDSALDTVERWNTATTSGVGNTLAVSSGALVATVGANTGYAYTTSKPIFQDPTPGQLRFAYNAQFEASPVAGVYRFWGSGNVQAAPTTAGCPACSNTMVDAVGFELNTDGKLYAVVYKSGTRTSLADLTSVIPTDGATHNYQIYWRPVEAQFYIDQSLYNSSPVATANFTQSALNKDALPAVFAIVQGSTNGATLSSNTMSVSDSARNNTTFSDGQYPWKKASVRSVASSGVATDLSLQVSINGVDPCASSSIPKSSAVINITTATTTSLVALSGSTVVYVCGFNVTTGSTTTANTIVFEYGTGGSCATSPVALTGIMNSLGMLTGNISAGNAGSTIFKTAAGNALCALSTVGSTPSIQGFVTYVQQ
jgi:hypothetical protein